MDVNTQIQSLNNALNSFGLKNIIVYGRQYGDKRKSISRFFLEKETKIISPVLDYNEMNNFIFGMGTMRKAIIESQLPEIIEKMSKLTIIIDNYLQEQSNNGIFPESIINENNKAKQLIKDATEFNTIY